MQILTSLNDLYEAQEILRWLHNHGIKAVLEGQLTYKMGPHVPNGLGIYILDDSQFQKAKLLLREFDAKYTQTNQRKRTLFSKLKDKKLDKLFIGVCTVIFTVLAIWFVSSLFA